MNLKEAILDDVGAVFMDLADFGQEIHFNGQAVTAIIDDSHNTLNLGAAGGFANGSGLGIIENARVMYMADTLQDMPVPEQQVEIDGELWMVEPGEQSVAREMGMLRIRVSRAYS